MKEPTNRYPNKIEIKYGNGIPIGHLARIFENINLINEELELSKGSVIVNEYEYTSDQPVRIKTPDKDINISKKDRVLRLHIAGTALFEKSPLQIIRIIIRDLTKFLQEVNDNQTYKNVPIIGVSHLTPFFERLLGKENISTNGIGDIPEHIANLYYMDSVGATMFMGTREPTRDEIKFFIVNPNKKEEIRKKLLRK